MAIRPWHRHVARLLVAALLFMQGALAAHACQMALDAAAAAPVAVAEPCCPHHGAEAVPADQHEHQTPAPDSSLCKAHCDQTQTSASAQLQLDTSALAACIASMHSPKLTTATTTLPLPVVRDPGPPPGTPPLYIAYAVLRR
jgi:hypothetical protein